MGEVLKADEGCLIHFYLPFIYQELFMNQTLEIARNTLLKPAGLNEQQLEKILGNILGSTIDNADLYFQAEYQESWVLEDGLVKEGSYHIHQGVGVRAMSGEKTGFAYSDDIVLPALNNAALAARSIAHHGQAGQLHISGNIVGHNLYPSINPLTTFDEQSKINLLRAIDAEARKIDSQDSSSHCEFSR